MITALSKPVEQQYVQQFTPIGNEYVQALGTIKQDTEKAIETNAALKSFANNLQGVEGSDDAVIAEQIKNEITGEVSKLVDNNPYLNNSLSSLRSLAIKYKDDPRIAQLAQNRAAYQKQLEEISNVKNASTEDIALMKQKALSDYNARIGEYTSKGGVGNLPSYSPIRTQDIANYGDITEKNAQQLALFSPYTDVEYGTDKNGKPIAYEVKSTYDLRIPNFEQRATESLAEANLRDRDFMISADYQADLRGLTGEAKEKFIKDLAVSNAASVVKARTKMISRKPIKDVSAKSATETKEEAKTKSDLAELSGLVNASETEMLSQSGSNIPLKDIVDIHNKVVTPSLKKISDLQTKFASKNIVLSEGKLKKVIGYVTQTNPDGSKVNVPTYQDLTSEEVRSNPELSRDMLDLFVAQGDVAEYNNVVRRTNEEKKQVVNKALGILPEYIGKDNTAVISEQSYEKLPSYLKRKTSKLDSGLYSINLQVTPSDSSEQIQTINSIKLSMREIDKINTTQYLENRKIQDRYEPELQITPYLINKFKEDKVGFGNQFIAKKEAIENQISEILQSNGSLGEAFTDDDSTVLNIVNEVGEPITRPSTAKFITIEGFTRGLGEKVKVTFKGTKNDTKGTSGYLDIKDLSPDFRELQESLDLISAGLPASADGFTQKKTAVKVRIEKTLNQKIDHLINSQDLKVINLDPLYNALAETNTVYNVDLVKNDDGTMSIYHNGKPKNVYINNTWVSAFTKENISAKGGLLGIMKNTYDKEQQEAQSAK